MLCLPRLQKLGFSELLLAVLVGVLLLPACAPPPQRGKRSFFGAAAGQREEVAPVGLNPLGFLETCRKGGSPDGREERVLISPPEFFTREASLMILSLGEALQSDSPRDKKVALLLSPGPITSSEQAAAEGLRCGALIVLWEREDSKTLELTLPEPSRIPLRSLVQENLCEFGNHSQQLTVLYLTILGLTALREPDYDKAQHFLGAANRMGDSCLKLPAHGGERPDGS